MREKLEPFYQQAHVSGLLLFFWKRDMFVLVPLLAKVYVEKEIFLSARLLNKGEKTLFLDG